MDSDYWLRWLIGGMWIRSFGYWKKVLPEHYETALRLRDKGFTIEDHRYFRRKP